MKLISKDYENSQYNHYKFRLSNGSISCLGALEESSSKDSGIFNLVEFDRLRPIFNPLFSLIKINDTILNPNFIKPIEHRIVYDLEKDLLSRESVYQVEDCKIKIQSERFLDFENDFLYMIYSFQTDKKVNLSFYQGINLSVETDSLIADNVKTENREIIISTNQDDANMLMLYEKDFRHINRNDSSRAIEHYSIDTEPDRIYTIKKYVAIGSDIDAMKSYLSTKRNIGYDLLKEKHCEIQSTAFSKDKINIFNNNEADLISSFMTRHLLNDVYRLNNTVNQEYNDLMLSFFYLHKQADKVKNMLSKHLNALTTKKDYALALGYKGAAFIDSPLAFEKGNRNILSGSFVIYLLKRYCDYTQDYSLLRAGGLETVIEICEFYQSYASLNDKDTRYNINNVSNLDASLNHIDNHTLTNYMIKYSIKTMKEFVQHLKTYFVVDYYRIIKDNKYESIIMNIEDFYQRIYIQRINVNGHLFPYQNFISDLQDNCLAGLEDQVDFTFDHLLLFTLLETSFPQSIIRNNYEYFYSIVKKNYENKHHFSLISLPSKSEEAFACFLEYASLAEASNLVNESGMHLDVLGSVYYFLVHRLSKLRLENSRFTADSLIPKKMSRLEYTIMYHNYMGEIKLKRNSARIDWKNIGGDTNEKKD